ncbi:MAG: hypothetical protein QXP39_03205 [Candidatus Aenigmatarchaeota archaeon]
MVDIGAITSGLGGLSATEGIKYWVGLGVNILLSTIIGGLVVIILTALLAREARGYGNAFIMVLLINIINMLGILGFVAPMIPFLGLILPVLVWIIFVKIFLGPSLLHSIIIGIIGWLLSIFLVPLLTSIVLPMLPL